MPILKKSLPSVVLLSTLGFNSSLVAQTCRTESEIPSSTPTAYFTDHGDGTVTHAATGLMWMKCPLGQEGADCSTGSASTFSWKSALDTAAASGFAGHSDWRLPDVNELRSIVEERCYQPAINTAVFPVTPSSYFWSSSPHASNSNYAWLVYFGYGNSYGDYRYYGRNVRLVRSGQ
jgi:hypothetical protein